MSEVAIESEACVLQCEIIYLVIEQARPGVWTSDWDVRGYCELGFLCVLVWVCDA